VLEPSFRYVDMLRALTDNEIAFITGIAHRLDDEASRRLMSDLASAQAEVTLPDGALIRFHLAGYQRAPYSGHRLYPAEGLMDDVDGSPIALLLFADPTDRLFELEYVRWWGGDLQKPNWSTVRFIPDSPPTKTGTA
jgi:hypothetical protein